MKKTMSIVATILILFGCDWKNQPENTKASSSPTPSVLSSAKPTIIPTKLPEPTVTPSFDGTGLDVYGKGIFCEKRENMKAKLDKPVNIAVKRDGSQVYVVNGKCGRKPYINDVGDYLGSKFCIENPSSPNAKKLYENDFNLDVVENSPILTIKDNGKINILYGDNSDFFYCSNDGIIATDESDYLYFSANRNVYKVNNDKQTEKVADLDELEKTNPNNFNKNGMIKGIVVKNHKIYLDVNFSKIPERYIPEKIDFKNVVPRSSKWESNIVYNTIKEVDYKNLRDVINLIIENNNRGFSIFDVYNDYMLVNNPILNNKNDHLYAYSNSLIKIPIKTNVNDENIKDNLSGYLLNVLTLLIESREKPFYMSNMKINSKGDIFLSITNQHQIWKISPQKLPELFAGYMKPDPEYKVIFETKEGFKDGKGIEALFSYPTGMAIDGQDNLYIADTGNNAIRKITPDGVVSTFYVEKGGN